jgi:hypothetical protein
MAEKERQKESYDTREITSLLLNSQFLAGCFRFAHASSPRAGIVSGYSPLLHLPVIRSWSMSPRGEGYRCPEIGWITRGSELPGSGSPKERSDEEWLGYRMRDTTNWKKLTNNLDESKSEVQTWSISVRSIVSVTGNHIWVHEHHVTPCSVGGGYQGCEDVYRVHFYCDLEEGCRTAGIIPKLHDVAIRIARIRIFIFENLENLHINITAVCLSY